jgi:hypothetical protein
VSRGGHDRLGFAVLDEPLLLKDTASRHGGTVQKAVVERERVWAGGGVGDSFGWGILVAVRDLSRAVLCGVWVAETREWRTVALA